MTLVKTLSRMVAHALALGFVLLLPMLPLLAKPVDQAGWAQRKQRVTLANGITVAYVETGDPAGEPLLLLHGYTDTSRVWTALAPQFARYRVLIPDQRGHGASDKPACCYTLSGFAHDATLFLDAMKVKRAHVVGHSLGSMVAQAMAADHPGRVDHMVLAGSTGLAPVKREDPLWSAVMTLNEPISSNTAFLEEWSPSASPTPVDPVLAAAIDREIAEVPLHVWRNVIRELAGNAFTARYAPGIRAPTLILSAEKDALFDRSHHDALASAIPHAAAVIVPEVGHNLVVERPEVIGPIITAFLADRAPPSPPAR